MGDRPPTDPARTHDHSSTAQGGDELAPSRVYTASRGLTHVVYRENGTVYADARSRNDSYSGSTLDVVLDQIHSNLGAEEYASVWIVPDSTHYEIASKVELAQRIVVYARHASIDVNADLVLYADDTGSDWFGVATATPEWYGGRFYVDAANAAVVVEDFISGQFHWQVMQPTSGGSSGNRQDVFRITTRQNFGAFWNISGTITEANRETGTGYDYLDLVNVPAGSGDGNAGARGRFDLILGLSDGGSNNRGIRVQSGATIYDADQAYVTAFVEGNNSNTLLYLDGNVSGVEWKFSGEGYNGATLITGGSNATGQLDYTTMGMTGTFDVVDSSWGSKPATHGNTALTNGYGTVSIGTGGSYGAAETAPGDPGAFPEMGVSIGGSFGTETLTVKFEMEYQDGTVKSITRTYTATTSDYEWLTNEEKFQLSPYWKKPVEGRIYAKVDEASTSATVDYHTVAQLFSR